MLNLTPIGIAAYIDCHGAKKMIWSIVYIVYICHRTYVPSKLQVE